MISATSMAALNPRYLRVGSQYILLVDMYPIPIISSQCLGGTLKCPHLDLGCKFDRWQKSAVHHRQGNTLSEELGTQ